MTFRVHDKIDTSICITIFDSFDAAQAEALQSTLDAIAKTKNTNLIIDMTDVAFMDSSGIGAIVYTYKRLQENGLTMELIGLHGQPLELLTSLNVDKVIPVQPLGEAA